MSTAGAKSKYDGSSVHELMPLYYARLFPVQQMAKWLAYGNDGKHPQANGSFFQRREFCFTLDGDIFVRYQSFKDGNELHAALKDRVPAKIDIGPVYNVDPSKRSAYSGLGSDRVFNPVERELVFDIDMTDYDDVRTCCSAGAICKSCWPLMSIAITIIDRGLRDDFGFENILWVFSGRRGVHCWVCDESARMLTDAQRSGVASYFSIYKGQEQNGGLTKALVNLGSAPRLHPSMEAALETLEKAWREVYLPNQKILETEEGCEAILQYVPDEDVKYEVRSKWAKRPRKAQQDSTDVSLQRWDELVSEIDRHINSSSMKDKRLKSALGRSKLEILFAYLYPRLDVEVSKKMNHLLKAPFCVHPKTGKVCVPIDPAAAWDFDIDTVPTVSQLLQEIDDAAAPGAKGEEWRKTSMCGAVEMFSDKFLDELTEANKSNLNAKAREAAAKPTLVW
eukprot:jgi/Tetstr1/462370/TSEL_007376.t1